MLLGNTLVFDESTVFRSLRKDNLTFDDVFENIVEFIKSDINSSYRISIGTDSQVGKGTVIVSCIHVHRIGKGAIGFLHKCYMSRALRNLREKIYMETCTSLQLAYLFEESKIKKITDMLGKKINKIDKEELLSKINDFDESKLKELNINKEDLKQKVSSEDLQKLSKMIGDQGDEIVERIKDFLK